MPVHVIPTCPQDQPFVGDAGLPFVRLVKTQAADVGAVGGHVVQRVGGADAAAAQVSAAPLADEGDPPVRQPAGIEIVPGAVGQLLQFRSVDVHAEDVKAAAFVPVALRGVGMVPMQRIAAILDVGKQDRPAVVRQVRGQERPAARVLALAVAAAVKRLGGLHVAGAARQLFAGQPPVGDDRVGQHVADLRLNSPAAERIAQHVQSAARRCRHAVVLVAHVVVQRSAVFDKQEFIEIQQRIGQRDFASYAAGLLVQLVACVRLLDVDARGSRLQFLQSPFLSSQIRRRGHGLDVGQQRRGPPQDDVQCVAVGLQDERLRLARFGRDAGKVAAVSQVVFQQRVLDLQFRHRRAVFADQREHAGRFGAERDAVDQQPQFGDRRPRLAARFVRRPQLKVAAFDWRRKRDHVLCREFAELTGGHGLARGLAVVADKALVPPDRPVAAAGTGQVGEAGQLVRRSQIDRDLVRMPRLAERKVCVPHAVGIAIQGAKPLVARMLAVHADIDHHSLGLGQGGGAQQPAASHQPNSCNS